MLKIFFSHLLPFFDLAKVLRGLIFLILTISFFTRTFLFYIIFVFSFQHQICCIYINFYYDIYSIKHSALAHNNTEDNQWISFPSSFMQQVIDNHCPNTHTKVNRASKPDLWQLYPLSRTFLSWTIGIASYDLLLLSHL